MTKKEIIDYVTETPHNANKRILSQQLDLYGSNISWNNLKDKPFYSKEEEVIIFPETEFTFKPWAGDFQYHDIAADDFKVIAGNKYDVIFDGIKYECTAYQIGANDVALGRYLSSGNQDLPFSLLFVEFPDYEIFFSKTLRFSIPTPAETVSHTLEIRTVNKTIKTIDPKYLPCDLMFKVGCEKGHPKFGPANMTKPIIVGGSLEAVLEKLANGEIPVVKVQYQAYNVNSGGFILGYGGEFTCDTDVYGTDVMFCHDIPHPQQDYTVLISMATDDPSFMQMTIWTHNTASSPSVVID